jgi:Transposase DDE domain
VLPRRWVVERTFAWLSRNRRLSKDYEALPCTEEAWIYLLGHDPADARPIDPMRAFQTPSYAEFNDGQYASIPPGIRLAFWKSNRQ